MGVGVAVGVGVGVGIGGEVTVSVVLPVTPPLAALIVLVPAATAVARPVELMVAWAVFEELQVTLPVRFCVEPSVKVPVAMNCWVVPSGMEGLAGVTAIEASVGSISVALTSAWLGVVAACAAGATTSNSTAARAIVIKVLVLPLSLDAEEPDRSGGDPAASSGMSGVPSHGLKSWRNDVRPARGAYRDTQQSHIGRATEVAGPHQQLPGIGARQELGEPAAPTPTMTGAERCPHAADENRRTSRIEGFGVGETMRRQDGQQKS